MFQPIFFTISMKFFVLDLRIYVGNIFREDITTCNLTGWIMKYFNKNQEVDPGGQ